jgi:hypothetical protein
VRRVGKAAGLAEGLVRAAIIDDDDLQRDSGVLENAGDFGGNDPDVCLLIVGGNDDADEGGGLAATRRSYQVYSLSAHSWLLLYAAEADASLCIGKIAIADAADTAPGEEAVCVGAGQDRQFLLPVMVRPESGVLDLGGVVVSGMAHQFVDAAGPEPGYEAFEVVEAEPTADADAEAGYGARASSPSVEPSERTDRQRSDHRRSSAALRDLPRGVADVLDRIVPRQFMDQRKQGRPHVDVLVGIQKPRAQPVRQAGQADNVGWLGAAARRRSHCKSNCWGDAITGTTWTKRSD